MTERAEIAYLTTPQRGVYVLNFQLSDQDSQKRIEIEISRRHLANILSDGVALALRDVDHRS